MSTIPLQALKRLMPQPKAPANGSPQSVAQMRAAVILRGIMAQKNPRSAAE